MANSIYSAHDKLTFSVPFMLEAHDCRADIDIEPIRNGAGFARTARITLQISSKTCPKPTRAVSVTMNFGEALWFVGHISDDPYPAFKDLLDFSERKVSIWREIQDDDALSRHFDFDNQTLESVIDWQYRLDPDVGPELAPFTLHN